MDDVGRCARVEIEHHHCRALDVALARERRVQLEVSEIRRPNERRQILGKAIIHHAVIALTPDPGCFHPLGPMHRTILFVEKLAFDTIGITFHGERPIFQMWQEHRRNTNVVVDYLSFCEPDLRIKHLVEIRDLNLAIFDD